MGTRDNNRTGASAPMESPETTNQDSARPTEDRIRQRAYDRYQERGGEHGHDTDDWLDAERELEGDAAQPGSKVPRNRDQELPRRKGDAIEPRVGSERGQDGERHTPDDA